MCVYHFSFPLMRASSCFPTSSPAFDVFGVPDFGHSNSCVLVDHCYFHLHFPDDKRHGTYFHMIFFICISLVNYLLRSLVHILTQVFTFLWLILKSSLYILDSSLLSDMSFANTNTFSHSEGIYLFAITTKVLCCFTFPSTVKQDTK